MKKNSIFNEETRRKEQDMTTWSEILVIKRWRCKTRNLQNFNNHDKSRRRSKFRTKIKYFYCDKPGYMKRKCRKFER